MPCAGHELVGRLEVRRGKPQRPAAAVAADDTAIHEVVVPEQRTGLVHASLGHQVPDARARHDEVLVADRLDFLDAKSTVLAERAKQRERSGAIASEQKVRPDPDLGRADPVQDAPFRRRAPAPTATAPVVKRTMATASRPARSNASSF